MALRPEGSFEMRDTTADVEKAVKAVESAPRRSDFKSALRGRYMTEREDGKWAINVPRDDHRAMGAVKELTRKTQHIRAEIGEEMRAQRTKVRVRTKDGRAVMVDASNEKFLARTQGVLPAPSYGGKTSTEGPDGMLWISIANVWVPTGRCKPGINCSWIDRPYAEGPQRDPDGNLWEWNTEAGEWEIRLYAEEGCDG